MIYVSKEQLKQVEYLIGQSIQGHHVLFDSETLKRVMSQKKDFPNVDRYLEELISQPTLSQKRDYLELLPSHLYEAVVRGFFNIVENNIFEREQVRH